MLDDISDIAAFYNHDPANEHTRLDRHPLEYDLTWRYLQRHLPPHGHILEVGAATGRYTLELARRGYTVTAVDLSAELLNVCRTRLVEAGRADQVACVVADARDLSAISEHQFDAALLMGPLYHLIREADRQMALQEVYDRLRPHGIIFSAWISRFGIIGDVMKRVPEWIENPHEVRAVLEQGHRPDDAPREGFRGYFATTTEIPPIHERCGFETIALVGVEPGISADDESYTALQEYQRTLWLDLLDRISTEPSIVGASRHLLYIGVKV